MSSITQVTEAISREELVQTLALHTLALFRCTRNSSLQRQYSRYHYA